MGGIAAEKYLIIMKIGHGWKSLHWQQAAGYECDKTKKGKGEVGEGGMWGMGRDAKSTLLPSMGGGERAALGQ